MSRSIRQLENLHKHYIDLLQSWRPTVTREFGHVEYKDVHRNRYAKVKHEFGVYNPKLFIGNCNPILQFRHIPYITN